MRKLTGTVILLGCALLAAGAAACSSDTAPVTQAAPAGAPAVESAAVDGQPDAEDESAYVPGISIDPELEKAAIAVATFGPAEVNTLATRYILEGYEPAPELASITAWGNAEPFTLESKRGSVVLIDFWTFACINCIRTFPHLNELHSKYADKGLQIVGVHYPEFQFEMDMEAVMEKAEEYGLRYPIVQDNLGGTWRAYKNRYWPALYLIDKKGFIRYKHFGEGAYEETDRKVRELLDEPG